MEYLLVFYQKILPDGCDIVVVVAGDIKLCCS